MTGRSVRQRDRSWDKKWADRQQTEEFRLRRPWTIPGRLNLSDAGRNINHRSICHLSSAEGKSDDSAKESDNVGEEVRSDMSTHHSDDLITIFTREGKGSPELCQENNCISSTHSQDTASKAEGDREKVNNIIENVKDELENNQTIEIRTTTLEMDHNDINGISAQEIQEEEEKEVMQPQLEMELVTISHKETEELLDNIDNKEENKIIEVIEKESCIVQEIPLSTFDLHDKESDIITCSKMISNNATVESDARKEDYVDPSLCLDYQASTPPPVGSGLLLLAAQDMSSTLTDILSTITTTPPSQGVIQSSTIPAIPSPSPSHPPESIFRDVKSFTDNQIEESEDPPPRPPLPINIIENLERKIETQYKKYPKFEQTPPRTPVPPERSDSQGKLKSVNPSPQNTPTLRRKQKISSNMSDTANIQKSRSYLSSKDKNADSISNYKLNSGIFQAKPVLLLHGEENNRISNDKKSKEEIAVIHQLEKEQNDVEAIIRKKKEQEHLKRLEFEENRIKEENEKLKIAAEEKKKREEEDARRLQEETEKMMILGKDEKEQKTRESQSKLQKRQIINVEESGLAEDKLEEEKIRIGREEAFREIESNKRNKNVHKKEKISMPEPNKQNGKASESISSMTELRNTKDEVTRRLEKLEDPRKIKNKHSTSEQHEMVFKDISNVTSFSVFNNPHQDTFSASRRWKDVHTGHVKDRANMYAVAEKEDNKKTSQIDRGLLRSRSWSTKRQINPDSSSSQDKAKKFANENEISLNIENDVDKRSEDKIKNVPWRKNIISKETQESVMRSPSLNLVSITIIPSSTTITEDNLSEPGLKNSQPVEDIRECEYSGGSNVANTNNGNHINNVGEVGTQDTSSLTKCEIKVQNEKDEIKMFCIESLDNKTDEHQNQKQKEEYEDSEYEDDFSIGIDLSIGQENTSVNVTPIPTTGELEDLNSVYDCVVEEDIQNEKEGRRSSLKSLLKKPSVDNPDASINSDSDSEDDIAGPKKVHFSDIDQVKMMSQDSLASLAASYGSVCMNNIAVHTPHAPARIVTHKQDNIGNTIGDKETNDKEGVMIRKEYIV